MVPMLPVADALARILEAGAPVTESERVPLGQAEGRVLAEDLAAQLTQPPFDASAMDGYALRCEDALENAELAVIGTSAAGNAFSGTLGPAEAVRIFTGAPVPASADTVIIQENTATPQPGRVRILSVPKPGANIRRKGQDFTEGEVALPAGTLMDFPRLTLAAAMDHATVPVYRKVRVAILATGDELVPPGEPRAPDQIVASSTYGVAALARAAGAEIIDLGIARDTQADITEAVDKARMAGADILVTLGGASVGDHDLVQPVLKSLGMTLDFWRVAMRPGKPLMVGSLGAMQVIGLPGNPVSTLVCSLLFLEPLIRHRAGLPPIDRMTTAIAATTLAANDHRQDYLRATLSRNTAGRLVATPVARQDSSLTRLFALSDALILREPLAPSLGPGEACPVLLLRP